MTIPVFIAPLYNRPDLLKRMLASVDVPVERGIVVDNGRSITSGLGLDIEIERLRMRWFAPPFATLGYGGSINFVITQTADAPWWFWASNDVHFEPGMLDRVVELMKDPAPRLVSGSFAWGAVNRAAVQAAGLIDEWSFFPIYFDDNDYHWRCVLTGVEWIELDGWNHGADGHTGSLTIHSDPAIKARNHDSFRENERRYLAKWGGRPGQEVFRQAWNLWPAWVTQPDVEGRASRVW